MIDRYLFSEKPKEVSIECTALCNCKCSFCHNLNSFAKGSRKKVELSTDDFKRMLDRICEAGVYRVRFTGGEPLFRKDIFDLAEHAKRNGMKTVLNTNGLLIDRDVGRRVSELFDVCLLSFFTCDPECLEQITRVKNAYQLKLEALQNIQGCKSIWCSTIIADPNLPKDLGKMAKIMESFGVHNWFLLRNIPVEEDKQPHSYEEIEQIVEAILELERATGRLVNIGNPIPFCAYKPDEIERIIGDGVIHLEARSSMVVDPLGDIVVDYSIRDKIGNLLEDDLLSCWQSDKLNLLRGDDLLPEVCKKCRLLKKCCGGSRFASMIVHGEYGHLDPLARPEKYREILFDK